MKSILLTLISYYQKTSKYRKATLRNLGLFASQPTIKVCKFSPTCSKFTYQAIERYGILKGMQLGLKRVLKCHPWSSGGYDPVPGKI